MSEAAGKTVECHRCDRQASLDDAVMLKQQNNKALWEYLCGECLADIGVPQGYEVQRDLSHLEADTAPTPSDDGEAASDTDDGVIADFRAEVVTDEAARDELIPARVVMNRSQLVFVTGGTRNALPLEAVHDVSVGHVPDSAREYFDDVVRLGYRSNEGDHLAFLGADRETLDRFVPLLFSTLLSGTTVRVRDGGGRGAVPLATEPDIDSGILDLAPGRVAIVSVGATRSIRLEHVVRLERRTGDWAGSGKPVLAVHAHDGGGLHRVDIALPTARKRGLLGRFLQQEFGDRRQRVAGMELDRTAIACLLCLFAGLDEESMGRVLGEDSTEELVARLAEAELVRIGGGSPELTSLGRVAVLDRFDELESAPPSTTPP
ncbi:MAG: CheF family chemotaxis protein [Halodesulfurarchaeum sp.]